MFRERFAPFGVALKTKSIGCHKQPLSKPDRLIARALEFRRVGDITASEGFAIIDRVELETMRQGEIPVDVLVARDGDNYESRISNNAIAPNSRKFLATDEENHRRNRRVEFIL